MRSFNLFYVPEIFLMLILMQLFYSFLTDEHYKCNVA
jgi:hypothetical protein